MQYMSVNKFKNWVSTCYVLESVLAYDCDEWTIRKQTIKRWSIGDVVMQISAEECTEYSQNSWTNIRCVVIKSSAKECTEYSRNRWPDRKPGDRPYWCCRTRPPRPRSMRQEMSRLESLVWLWKQMMIYTSHTCRSHYVIYYLVNNRTPLYHTVSHIGSAVCFKQYRYALVS